MTNDPRVPRSSGGGHQGHGGHGWMMLICCIPMLVIAVALVAVGTVSPGFLFAALLCTAMMALMMRGMNHASGPDERIDTNPHQHDRHRAT